MKRTCIFVIAAFAAACGGSSNNTTSNVANMRGTNTNTGYFQNANTSVPPAMPANATNISPSSLSSGNTKTGTNANSHSNTNAKK